jgi:hypothetical protein
MRLRGRLTSLERRRGPAIGPGDPCRRHRIGALVVSIDGPPSIPADVPACEVCGRRTVLVESLVVVSTHEDVEALNTSFQICPQ